MEDDKPLRLVIPVLPPWFWPVTENNVTRVEGQERLEAEFVYKYFTNLKKRVEYVPSDGIFFGQYFGPGNWSGAYGMIARGEADAMIGAHAPTLEAFPNFGFTPSIHPATFTILSGPPKAFQEGSDSLLASIHQNVWITLGFTWIILSVLSYLFAKVEKIMNYTNKHETTLFGTAFAYYGLLFERGFDYMPSSNFRRLLLAGWLILCEVLMSDIGGTLASKLAIFDVPQRIDNQQDVIDHKEICPYTAKGIFLDRILQESTQLIDQQLWSRITSCNGVQIYSDYFNPEFMDKINDGTAVLIENHEFAIGEIASQECRRQTRPLYLGKEPVYTSNYVFYYRKDLDFERAEMFRICATRYAECGFVILCSRNNFKDSLPCFAESFRPTTISAVSIKDLNRVFQIWMIGMAISCLVLLSEIIPYYFKHNN